MGDLSPGGSRCSSFRDAIVLEPFQPPTDGERRAFQAKQAEFACRAADLAKDFYSRFPDHSMAPAAKGMERSLMGPYASHVLDCGANKIEEEALARGPAGSSPMLAAMEKGAQEMLARFPSELVPNQLLLKVARQSEPLKARQLAEEVRNRPGLADFVKEEAGELHMKLDRVGKPLALKFRAVDEREVDLANLKDKVVLIDFWATWCVPCVAGLPGIKSIYEQLHGQGFEIVGISLDQQKESLTSLELIS